MIKKYVSIIEKATGKTIATYPVVLAVGASDSQYHEEAWNCGIEDGLVKEGQSKYSFQID